MLKRFEICKFSVQAEENIELAGWAWNSHYWIETKPGYCQCKYCGKTHTSEMGIGKDYPLCKENPILKERI